MDQRLAFISNFIIRFSVIESILKFHKGCSKSIDMYVSIQQPSFNRSKMLSTSTVKKKDAKRYLFYSGCICIVISFLFVIYQNFENYTNRKIRYEMITDYTKEIYRWPNIIVVEPSFPYNLLRFKELAFDFYPNCDFKQTYDIIEMRTCAKYLEMSLNNLTGNDLVWAAWTPGELVERVKFGTTVVNYSISDKFFEHWTLEFVNNLPQWKFIPPPTSKASDTLTIVSRTDVTFPECRRFKNGTKFEFSLERCSDFEMKISCNSSCRYENFLRKYNGRVQMNQFVKFHVESMTDEYSMKRITGKRMIKRTNTHVEYYTKDTRFDDEHNLDDCMMKCYTEIANSYNCVFLGKFTLNKPLSSNCYVNQSKHLKSVKGRYESLCSNKCSNSKKESFWRFIKDNGTLNVGYMRIHLANNGIKNLFPIESYSFVQLLSDVGGSAGFFLEVAIMPLVIAVFSFGLKMFLNRSTRDKLRKFGMLFKLPLILVLGILLIRDLNEIFNINDEKYVGFVSSSCFGRAKLFQFCHCS